MSTVLPIPTIMILLIKKSYDIFVRFRLQIKSFAVEMVLILTTRQQTIDRRIDYLVKLNLMI